MNNYNKSAFSVRVNRDLIAKRYREAVRKKQQWDLGAGNIQRQLLTVLLKWIEDGKIDLTEIDAHEME